MILRKLLSLCMDTIQDGIIDGVLVDFDHLPKDLRQLIFVMFQRRRVAQNDDSNDHALPRCLLRGGFYSHFEHLRTLELRSCHRYDKLLSTIAAELERPGNSLVSTLVSLQLRVCCERWLLCYTLKGLLKLAGVSSSHAINLCSLIAACRNLRELHLKKCRFCFQIPERSYSETCFNFSLPLDEIRMALRHRGDNAPPLKKLVLDGFYDCHIRNNTLLSSFGSLQALVLRNCVLSTKACSRLTQPCRQTLQSLTLEATCIKVSKPTCKLFGWFGMTRRETATEFDALRQLDSAVELPVLTSFFTDRSHWWLDKWTMLPSTQRRWLLSVEAFGRLQHGRICLSDTCSPDVLTMLADCLSPEVELSFRLGDDLNFERLTSAQRLFGRRLVELHIGTKSGVFPRLEAYKETLSELKSIRVLIMYSDFARVDQNRGDRFLRRFLSDPGRGANLRRLRIDWDLESETLILLFRHCVNLEHLWVAQHRSRWIALPVITDEHLTMWAANGARPREVYFGYKTNITADGIRRLLRNCGGQLTASFLDERGRLINNIPVVP